MKPKCNYPNCDGGPSTGYCKTECRSDLVERLRGTRWVGTAFHAEAVEAADEIDRLRAALEYIADQADYNWTKAHAAKALGRIIEP